MSSIAGRVVRFIRCHTQPQIGNKPRNAILMKDIGAEGFVNEEATAVVIKHLGREHVVPFTNIEAFELEPEPEVIQLKRGPKPKIEPA